MCSCPEHSRGCQLASLVERFLKILDLTDFLALFKGELDQEHSRKKDVLQQVTYSIRSVSIVEPV